MRKLIYTIILFLAILMFFVSVVYTQVVDPAATYNLKKISLKNFRACHDIKDWIVTGNRTSVVFATDWDWNAFDSDLVAFGLNNKGVASPASQILPGYVSTLVELSAVWIENISSSPAKKASGHGLVFAAYQNADRTKGIVSVRKFDANGTMTSGWKKITEVTAGPDQKIGDQWVFAEVGPDSVALAYSVLITENSSEYTGYKQTIAYFIETDFNGNLLPETDGQLSMRNIAVPDNGILKIFRVFRPAWNGKRWLVPASNTRLKLVPDVYGSLDSWAILGEDVMVLAVKDRTQAVLTPNKLFSQGLSKFLSYVYDLQFLPNFSSEQAVPSGKLGEPLKLFIKKSMSIPENQRVYQNKSYSHGIQTVTGKGKKAGPMVTVNIPAWNCSLPYDPDALYTREDDYISDPVPSDDGSIILAQIYTMCRGRNAVPTFTYDYDSELNLLKIDPDTGAVTTLAHKIPVYDGYFDPPHINWFKNKIMVINSLVYRGAQYHVDPYVSIF